MSGDAHGGADLPGVHVDGYNAELRDEGGDFVGDRASHRAFHGLLDTLRERFADDPLGGEGDIDGQRLDAMLRDGDPQAGGIVVGAIEAWAREFAHVVQRFLHLPEWHGTERIAVGGGLRGMRVGELAIGRSVVLLRGDGASLDLVPICQDPDEAGLIGAAGLFTPEERSAGDALLTVDIGGTKIRAGLIALRAADLSGAAVVAGEQWRHGEEEPTRDEAVERLADMLRRLAEQARERGLHLASLVGIGCPGAIRPDGTIERGGQNLPGDWEDPGFNLPRQIASALPGDWRVLMHNDAVVQGLSEAHRMRDVRRWGVMTAGTGLGNARFTNT